MGCASSNIAVEAEIVFDRDFHREYRLKEKLGQGACGVVYAAAQSSGTDESVEQLAVKVVDLREASSKRFGFDEKKMRVDRKKERNIMHEVAILTAVGSHDNLCRMSEAFIHEGFAYIVVERYDRTLREALESCSTLNEETLRPFFQGMLTGIAAIHARRIVHRDVKPDNFMCSGPANTMKLCDFGTACTLDARDAAESVKGAGVVGTPPFMPPEVLQEKGYGAKVDVWSFGVVLHVLICGRFPYMPQKMTRDAMMAAIRSGSPTPKIFFDGKHHRTSSNMSEEARQFIVSLLARSADARPTSAEALFDEYFTSGSLSQICLRRRLQMAQQCHAFSDTSGYTSDVDHRLRNLQNRHYQLAPAKIESMVSVGSTDEGSRLDESNQI